MATAEYGKAPAGAIFVGRPLLQGVDDLAIAEPDQMEADTAAVEAIQGPTLEGSKPSFRARFFKSDSATAVHAPDGELAQAVLHRRNAGARTVMGKALKTAGNQKANPISVTFPAGVFTAGKLISCIFGTEVVPGGARFVFTCSDNPGPSATGFDGWLACDLASGVNQATIHYFAIQER